VVRFIRNCRVSGFREMVSFDGERPEREEALEASKKELIIQK
jgi:hypothetical protein